MNLGKSCRRLIKVNFSLQYYLYGLRELHRLSKYPMVIGIKGQKIVYVVCVYVVVVEGMMY